MTDPDYADWLDADAEDRRSALFAATQIITTEHCTEHRGERDGEHRDGDEWFALADRAYRWLRNRDSLHATTVRITPHKPVPEGTTMATIFDLSDTDSVEFTLTGTDAKGATVPLDDGFTAAWSLADPDATGATLTPSADTTSAVVGAGVPDSNLMLSVAVTNPDGSVLNGAEAIIVLATAATTVSLVPGTPAPE